MVVPVIGKLLLCAILAVVSAPRQTWAQETYTVSQVTSYLHYDASDLDTNSAVVSSVMSFLYNDAPGEDTNSPVASGVMSYLYQDVIGSETNSPVASRVMSYLYYDAPGADTNSAVLSRGVSYLYYDWPGNENVTFQTSPVLSYLYQGGASGGLVFFQGRVVDAQGRPLGEAVVTACVLDLLDSSATTGTDGRYTLAEVPAGTYVLNATKPGWVSDRRVVALSTATMHQDFLLRPFPTPPSLTVADSMPACILPPDGAQGSVLRVFDGTAFIGNPSLADRTKMSIVLTHGWIPSLEGPGPPTLAGGWPSNLASVLTAQGVRSVANIVAWDWQGAATSGLPPEEATPQQGIALGEALQQALGTDYRKYVHFIGHSLGTLVNGYAVDYLHGHQRAGHRLAAKPWLASNTHVTMVDDAAISRLIAKQTLAELLLSGGNAYVPSVVLGWKNPVPQDFRWLDNYISSVGRYHPEAVNVLLQKGMLLALADHSWFDSAVQAHGYGITNWYPQSVTSANRVMPGFGTSFEYAALHSTADFPPTGPEFVQGIAFRQSESSGDELALDLITDPELRLYYPAVSVPGVAGAEAISDWVETKLDEAASAGRRLGNVLVEVGQTATVTVEAAVDRVVSGAGGAWNGLMDMLNRPEIHIQMQTGLPPWMKGARQSKAGGEPTNTPAAIWLPVALPANVSMMAFDFAVDGDGKDDALVFGINGTNLFTLATKFIPVGVTNTSRFLDVSTYAGTTNEFFFGILGGTSTNCAVHIEGIRFYTFENPSLIIAQSNGVTYLSWPSTASSYILESAADLTTSVWSVVTNQPSLFGGRLTVTNTWSDAARFFRLRRQ